MMMIPVHESQNFEAKSVKYSFRHKDKGKIIKTESMYNQNKLMTGFEEI